MLRATPPEFLDLSDIPKMRQKFIEAMAKIAKPPRPEGLEIADHRPSDDVTVRVYRPAGLEASAPALYWIHGGGLVMGTVDMDDDYCAGLAHRLKIVVASVEYRLAPDFPYPVPLEDCYTGLRWLHSNAGFARRRRHAHRDRRRIRRRGALRRARPVGPRPPPRCPSATSSSCSR